MKLLDRVRHLGGPSTTDADGAGPSDSAGKDATSSQREKAVEEAGLRPSSPQEAEHVAKGVPGGNAESPQDIPKAGWLAIAKRGWKEAKTDNVPLLAAGVAFYAFLSIFPAIIAAVLLYGLVANPATIEKQINGLGTAIPPAAKSLLTDQMQSLTSSSSQGLGWGLIVSVLVALWSASNGAGNLIKAINVAYDEEDTRNFVKQKGLALLVTVGAIIFVVVAVGLIAALPVVMKALSITGGIAVVVQIVRWVLLLGFVVAALAIVYRLAPNRDAPKMKWTSVGAAVATVLWIIVSVGFSLYTSLGSYGSSYGSLAGVVVLLMWLWLTSYAILLGAEINAESEQQTVKDTTKGAPQPIGQRNAYKADTLPG